MCYGVRAKRSPINVEWKSKAAGEASPCTYILPSSTDGRVGSRKAVRKKLLRGESVSGQEAEVVVGGVKQYSDCCACERVFRTLCQEGGGRTRIGHDTKSPVSFRGSTRDFTLARPSLLPMSTQHRTAASCHRNLEKSRAVLLYEEQVKKKPFSGLPKWLEVLAPGFLSPPFHA